MSALLASSPLMQPVAYQGQTYFTSQYFHQQYLANSPHGGKYRRHDNFLQSVRTIPTYPDLIQGEHIVELEWKRVSASKDVLTEIFSYFKSLFQLTGYRPLTLLDSVAQAELFHHLEDEASRAAAMAINTSVARQAVRKTSLPHSTDTAKVIIGNVLDIAAMLGTSLHIAQQEAVKLAAKETGLDFRPLLQAAPAQNAIPIEERMLEPTDLAKEFGWGENQGRRMNGAIARLGWQVKNIGGGWEATPAGAPHCLIHAWTVEQGTKSGYNLKWNVAAVRAALTTQQQGGGTP